MTPKMIYPWLCAALLAMVAGTAAAGTLDPQTGRMTHDGDVAISYDSAAAFPAELALTVNDETFTPLDPSEVAGMFQYDTTGLQGAAAMRFGGQAAWATFNPASWGLQLSGRRVEMRVWQKPCGTEALFAVSWHTPGETNPLYVGMTKFVPTGRATDDGWREWSSGPLDFSWGGVFAPVEIAIIDLQFIGAMFGTLASIDPDACTMIDAFEVFDLGPAEVPAVACDVPTAASVCGPQGVCVFGRCTDGSSVVSVPPADDAIRADYFNRRSFEYRTFEGGRIPQTLMPDFQATLAGLIDETPTPAVTIAFNNAVSSLRDGHASPPTHPRPANFSLGICAHLGEADLLPGGGLLPLVFSKATDNPVATQLELGDALVSIDGLAPLEWGTTRGLAVAGDPRSADIVIASWLIDAALGAGSTLTFSRCTNPPATPDPCDPADLLTFDVDLAALVGDPIWTSLAPAWMMDFDTCDFRFQRGVTDPNVKSSDFAGFADQGGIRTLLINAVPGRPAWENTVYAALDPAPGLLILDQRLGHGGAITSVDLLAGMLVAEADFDSMLLLPWVERTFDDGLRDTFTACPNSYVVDETCGASFVWTLGGEVDLGAARAIAADTPLAILNANDVSGNDFTSRLLSYRTGPTRIFGSAGAIRGAYGVIWSLPRHLHEFLGGSFQIHDTLFSSDGVTYSEFATGLGVEPDEVVWQSQRDILAGVDTVVETARAWLLAGVW